MEGMPYSLNGLRGIPNNLGPRVLGSGGAKIPRTPKSARTILRTRPKKEMVVLQAKEVARLVMVKMTADSKSERKNTGDTRNLYGQ